MSIEVANESGLVVDEEALLDVATHVLEQLHVHPLAELNVLCVDVETMTSLHVQWMDEQGPTDVLSFPMDELRPGNETERSAEGLLGDVVLCPEVAERQARAAGHPASDELHLLCTHGILHLLGYDHAEPADEREMFALQRRLLESWRGVRTAGT